MQIRKIVEQRADDSLPPPSKADMMRARLVSLKARNSSATCALACSSRIGPLVHLPS
jgi:hypothetical protein